MAEGFLAERDQIQDRYLSYTSRWLASGAIEKDPAGFVDETRAILMELGTRMVQEDREFHPLILQRSDAT